jgi:sugar phosphate isomerase/epimerase
VIAIPRIACSETLLDRPLVAAWHIARRAGVQGVEVYGSPDDLERRLASLKGDRRRGVVFSTVCAGPPFLGRCDAHTIGDAVCAAKRAISITAELEATGIVMPVAAPPAFRSTCPRDLEPYLVDAFAELARHAESVGTTVVVEPLNRYEDGAINRLEQAVELCHEVGSQSLHVVGDFFHMNIEERDVAEAIGRAHARLRHVHVADSNRLQPGAGHLDFPYLLGALRAIGFDGWLTLECILDGAVEEALHGAVRVLEEAWEIAAALATGHGSPGRQDDAPSSSRAAPRTAPASTARR